jgi:hypothetical protein
MKLSACLILLALSIPAFSEQVQVSIPLGSTEVLTEEAGPYTRVWVEGERVIGEEGLPSLPLVGYRVALPTGAVADGIEIVDATWQPLRAYANVMPAGPTLPLSLEQVIHPVNPDPHIYGLDRDFPFEFVELTGSGCILGIPVADLLVYPARWNPADRTLEVLTSLSVNVSYHIDPASQTIVRRSFLSEQRSMDAVRSVVVNPEGVSGSGAMLVQPNELAYGEYVIITHPDYATQMQELADWKTSKGVPTNVYTTTWIQGQYSCYDLQQEIRAFLVACRNEGAEWILICGDDDKVACRDAILSAGGETAYAPVDLYFADVNDTGPGADRWDSNNNHIWGETSDAVEWHPDFWVGRASVNSAAEAALYVDKVLIYEHMQTPPGQDYFETAPVELRIGYTTGILWYSPYCPGSAGAEIISGYVPDSPVWEEEKLNEGTTGNSTAMTIAMINAGPHHVYHASHGSETSMYTANGDNFTAGQIMALTNMSTGDNVAIWNSIACLIGALDTGTCCGDAWNNSTNGGGFGAFNSRYGWGTPSSPGNGPSEVICERFYYEYWNSGNWYLGQAHALATDHFCPPSDTYMNWSLKEYNLLGDPELPMWTAQHMTLTVSHPASITGYSNVTFTVNGTSGPLNGARVCIQKGNWQTGEVYEVGTTNSSGQVTLYATPETTGTINVRVWAHNYNTYSGTITVNGTGTEDDHGLTLVTSLGMVTPSPAISSASIQYCLGQAGAASIAVYDLTGRVVTTLEDGWMPEGNHSTGWDLTDDSGRTVPAGVYHIRMTSGSFQDTRQLVVIR